MQESGIVDIQSHTMTHTWHFSGPDIEDFYHPGSGRELPWMIWNAVPESKPAYLARQQEAAVPYGTPIYRHARALAGKRYIEDAELTRHLVNHVESLGGSGFFERAEWHTVLHETVSAYRDKHGAGDRFETDREWEARMHFELDTSKTTIERKLGKTVEFLAWPGGSFAPSLPRMAHDAGYTGVTRPSGVTADRAAELCPDLLWVKRMGCGSTIRVASDTSVYTKPSHILRTIRMHQGNVPALWGHRLRKRLLRCRHRLVPYKDCRA